MPKTNKASFTKSIKLWGIILLIGISVSIVAVDIVGFYSDLNFRADQMRTDYVSRQKKIIKQEVTRVVDMISYGKQNSEVLTGKKIKSRVYEGYSIAQNIYQKNKSTKNKAEIQENILEVLRSIRFEEETGYYFVIRTDGVVMLNANKPELEGKNLLELKDTHGKSFIKEMIKIAQLSGEGFDEYYWAKPGLEDNNFKKISFIKSFKPYNWIIGAGLYVDDVEEQIKNELLATISRIRFGKEGYIFINKLNGDALVSNGKLVPGTKKLWEVFDKNPEKTKDLFDKEYNAALKPEGDYIYYSLVKLSNQNKESPKASFIYGVPEWSWLIGAGVYLDDVESDIALMQTNLARQIKAKVLYFVLITVGIVAFFLLLFSKLNSRLKNDFSQFVTFFDQAALSDKEIDRKKIKFIELDRMAEYANTMMTDRKKAEEALRESEKRWHRIVENAAVGIYQVTDYGSIEMVNPASAKIFGYRSADDLLTNVNNISELYLNPEDRASILHEIDKNGYVDGAEAQFRHRDGKTIWIRISARIYRNKPGKVIYEGFMVDITDVKQGEKALKESEEKLRNIVEYSTNLFYSHTVEHELLYISPQVRDFLQCEPEEALTRWTEFATDNEINQKGIELTQRAIKTGMRQQPYELELVGKKGKKIYVEVREAPIVEDGKTVAIVGSLTDITDRKMVEQEKAKLQSQLIQSQKVESIGNLAGGIAHDFNNILTSIIGFTELSLDDVATGTPLEGNLQEVYTAGKRARDLVKQILAFARQSDEERKPIRVDTIAKEVTKLIRSTIPTTIEIREEIESTSLIMGNLSQVHQLFINLCTNAAQAMDDGGGVLDVRLADFELNGNSAPILSDLKTGNYIRITVSDTGPGIPSTIIDSIFEPYFTTKGVGEGTGMGLAMTHGIVESYGGKITVDSKVGKGTIFTIYLPTTKMPEVPRPYDREKNPPGAERILLVDDEFPIAKMGSQILSRLGYSVTIRTSSIEALELFRSRPDDFDLVITDMTMPNMTGDELAMELIAFRSDIPVILCTGYSKKITEQKAANIGIKAFVYKPIVKDDLAKIIRKVLDGTEAKKKG